MNEELLKSIGLTTEELQERVISAAVKQLMESVGYDEDGDDFHDHSPLAKKLREQIVKRIDRGVERIGNERVDPMVAEIINGVVLQKTNEWGEKKGEPVSFHAYLVQRAEAYMTAPVDFQGRSKDEDRCGSGWSQKSTRLIYMINKHLQYHIETAMRQALADANATLAKGIEDGIKVQLAALLAGLKVKAEVG